MSAHRPRIVRFGAFLMERGKIMEIVRISVSMFPGAAYWCSATYEEVKEGESFIADDYRFWLDNEDEIFGDGIDEAAANSPCGVFERESGEHGEIWFPRPEGAEFIAEGRALGVVYPTGDGLFEASLLPSMAFFFGSSGQVSPLETEAIERAMSHRIFLGTFTTMEDAVAEITKQNGWFR